MTLVTLSGHIKVPIADLDAVLEELPTHIALTRSEPGCLRFEVEADSSDPTVFYVNEEFLALIVDLPRRQRLPACR